MSQNKRKLKYIEHIKRIVLRLECSLIKRMGKKRGRFLTEKLIKNQYFLFTDKKLNLINPTSFDEKINWIKLNYYDPLYETCTDKVEVRKYVKDKGLGHLLTKVYAVYEKISDIDFDNIPNQCVIKTTHGSGCVCVIEDKNNINKKEILNKLRKSMKTNLYLDMGEWQYKNLKPRIIVEELIESPNTLIDYKFFCFDGKVRLIYVAKGVAISSDFTSDYYDENWNYLDINRSGHKHNGYIKKPDKLKEMIMVAETLSKDFVHVRVDLYCKKNKIYFGELTFTTGSGYTKHGEEEIFTKYFDINKLKNTSK